MTLIRYVCTHCGRHFEDEDKEILECPGCFWSTSVKREEDHDPNASLRQTTAANKKQSGSPLVINWKGLIVIVLGSLLFFAVAVALVVYSPALIKWIDWKFRKPSTIVLIKAESDQVASNGQNNPGVQNNFVPPVLDDADKTILSRKIELPSERVLTPEEEEVLKVHVPIETGVVEKLPSQPWNLDNFKQMISEQEKFYKVTLPTTYRWKLEKVFKEKYLTAQEAFKADDLLKARNLWVESLAFPVYANDVRKHRGVVLTMLRPFINDTLSKIGAINNSLAEGSAREKERIISETYLRLTESLEKRNWPGAQSLMNELGQMIRDVGQPLASAAKVPPYPVAASQIDQDILKALTDVLSPPAPSVANLAPLETDLHAKREVIESLIPENVEIQKDLYSEAVSLIEKDQCDLAAQKLRLIRYPKALAQDAAEKLKVLEKMCPPERDRSGAGALDS